MADITSRATSALTPHLQPDESIIAALLVEPKDSYAIAEETDEDDSKKQATDDPDEPEQNEQARWGIAEIFPTTPCVIALTTQQVIISESNGIDFQQPSLKLQQDRMQIVKQTEHGLITTLEIEFSDGSSVTVDAQSDQPFSSFK